MSSICVSHEVYPREPPGGLRVESISGFNLSSAGRYSHFLMCRGALDPPIGGEEKQFYGAGGRRGEQKLNGEEGNKLGRSAMEVRETEMNKHKKENWISK